jgi:hypothetical protein
MEHPVRYLVEPPAAERNRVTALVRPLLALPHVLLVGGPVIGVMGGGYRTGAFGLLAITIALLDWFAILFTGHPIEELQPLKHTYLEWRARVLAYTAFLRDEYPPFGSGPYPAALALPTQVATRDRLTVGLRPLLVIPHLFVLLALLLAWIVVALVSWVTIVVNGRLSPALWRFGRDVMAYSLRVEAYLLLVHDEFPPFALSEEPAAAPAAAPVV